RSVAAVGEGAELGIDDVSLNLSEGEILGVAGVDGNGQRALAEVIAGQRRAARGDVFLFGGPVTRMPMAARQKLGLRYVTDDRLGEGIVRSLPVGINLFLKRIGQPPFWRHGRIRLAGGGGGAVLISTDLDELLELCDRISVLSRGRIVGTVANGPGAAEEVGRLMVGVEAA